MPRIRFTYGLDFGTSKTALTSAQTDMANPLIIDVAVDSNEHDRMPSCLLRDSSREPPRVHVGSAAEQQYLLSQHVPGAPKFEFFANFKPHIHHSEEMRSVARDFLSEFRRTERVSELFLRNGSEAVVVVGCPVSWAADGAGTLLRLLSDADFPPAFAVPEPVGAAFYFLGTQLGAQDFHEDIVVFDWGAGTFDMTTMRAGRMDFHGSMSWGSTLYGGRIFDDLFYQWLIEQAAARGRYADLARLAEAPTHRAVLRGLTARKIKEAYSRHYASRSGDLPWTFGPKLILGGEDDVINLGDFSVAQPSEFEARMRGYKAGDEVRKWLDLAATEAQPEEAEFVARLRAGEPADLKAWGTRLIETGIRRLGVSDNAIAVLTGGSCNWRWFIEHVRLTPPFAGRTRAVVRDDKPELTIARGLTRAYAVGSYTKRLLKEVAARRDELASALIAIHREMLESLSYSLTAEIKLDDSLRDDLRGLLEQGLSEAQAARNAGFTARMMRLFDIILDDPAAAAVRPALEQRISRWLVENRRQLDRWSVRFSTEANRRVMMILRAHINAEIGGLVEVAIAACGATGQTPFDQALRTLGGRVAFEPNVLARIFKEATAWTADLVRALGLGGESSDATTRWHEAEAAKMLATFYERMPAAIFANIVRLQPAEQWARRVTDDLVRTLETLVRVARVDEAERVSGLRAD